MADIILTGAAGGIGQALARVLAAEPGHQLILARGDAARLAPTG